MHRKWCHRPQEKLLADHFGQVVLMLDGDEAGRDATEKIADRLHRVIIQSGCCRTHRWRSTRSALGGGYSHRARRDAVKLPWRKSHDDPFDSFGMSLLYVYIPGVLQLSAGT
ncbi:MAG: toprim domain-containing protein [Acidobacteriia bacterium]|nr:toprim domain-containing protein [Terriglobia bacterium]MBV8906973.1 toprim domain-containing protein [Terriglobia bacterium]